MRHTREFFAEWSLYVRKNRAASTAYYAEGDGEQVDCLTGNCDDSHLCWRCRRKAEDDLRIATSVDECAELLALLALPRPPRGQVEPCGTTAAYKRHLRHKEKACEPCLLAVRIAEDGQRQARAQKAAEG